MAADDRTPSAASSWRWFLLGLLVGQLLFALSQHFLVTPGLDLNWPVVAVLVAAIGLILSYEIGRRFRDRRGS